jgi:hypothetical protein
MSFGSRVANGVAFVWLLSVGCVFALALTGELVYPDTGATFWASLAWMGAALATWALLLLAAIGRMRSRRGRVWRLALLSPLCLFGPIVLVLFLLIRRARRGFLGDLQSALGWHTD